MIKGIKASAIMTLCMHVSIHAMIQDKKSSDVSLITQLKNDLKKKVEVVLMCLKEEKIKVPKPVLNIITTDALEEVNFNQKLAAWAEQYHDSNYLEKQKAFYELLANAKVEEKETISESSAEMSSRKRTLFNDSRLLNFSVYEGNSMGLPFEGMSIERKNTKIRRVDQQEKGNWGFGVNNDNTIEYDVLHRGDEKNDVFGAYYHEQSKCYFLKNSKKNSSISPKEAFNLLQDHWIADKNLSIEDNKFFR